MGRSEIRLPESDVYFTIFGIVTETELHYKIIRRDSGGVFSMFSTLF